MYFTHWKVIGYEVSWDNFKTVAYLTVTRIHAGKRYQIYVLCWSLISFQRAICWKKNRYLVKNAGFFNSNIVAILDKLFSSAIVFRRDISNAICDLVLHRQSEGLNTSWMYLVQFHTLKNGICNTVFYSVASWKTIYFYNKLWIDMRSLR